MGESNTSVRRLAALERHLEALELRKYGKSYQFIADALGYRTPSGAYKAVHSAIKKTLQEPTDEVRRMELERTELLLDKLFGQLKSGNHSTINMILKVLDRRSKYLGLDMPHKIAHTDPSGKERVEVKLVWPEDEDLEVP